MSSNSSLLRVKRAASPNTRRLCLTTNWVKAPSSPAHADLTRISSEGSLASAVVMESATYPVPTGLGNESAFRLSRSHNRIVVRLQILYLHFSCCASLNCCLCTIDRECSEKVTFFFCIIIRVSTLSILLTGGGRADSSGR
jgi:hypothetical protein